MLCPAAELVMAGEEERIDGEWHSRRLGFPRALPGAIREGGEGESFLIWPAFEDGKV